MNIISKIMRLFKRPKSTSQKVPYLLIGEKKGVEKLVDSFYDIMDTAPEARACRQLHPASLEESRRKLKFFLTQWFGGPGTYSKLYGHPRMRMRHLKFKITSVEREQWLWCMDRAIEELKREQSISQELELFMRQSFQSFAQHMQNS